MAEKIYKIQKELEEKRRSRLQKQIINQAPLTAQGAQPPGLPLTSALGPRPQSEYTAPTLLPYLYFVGGVVSMRSNLVSVSTQNLKEAFSVDDGDKDLVFVVGFELDD